LERRGKRGDAEREGERGNKGGGGRDREREVEFPQTLVEIFNSI